MYESLPETEKFFFGRKDLTYIDRNTYPGLLAVEHAMALIFGNPNVGLVKDTLLNLSMDAFQSGYEKGIKNA